LRLLDCAMVELQTFHRASKHQAAATRRLSRHPHRAHAELQPNIALGES